MIKNFEQFLFESQDSDTRLVDFFSSLARNYETNRPFYTDQVQFDISQEWRKWEDTVKYVKLEKNVDIDASYKINFTLDQKNYILKVGFVFTIKGQNEKDAPEALSDEDVGRLNIVLENITVDSIDLKSTDFDINKTKKELKEPVRKACEAFLVKVLEADYDSLGSEIYKIEQ
jgi:hypothetical protein